MYQNTSIKRLIDQLLIAALNQGASDIHFEPYADEYRIRFRIDGVLHYAMKLDLTLSPRITSRLKIMANLDIAEKRLPQDGQLLFLQDKKEYVMRMSTLPIRNGEKIALRIIKQANECIDIAQLGFGTKELLYYKSALNMSQGLILVCGPTGSGKTATLYSGLYQIDRNKRNVCCVEDPIEIPLSGINQCQINKKYNLTFAKILRALLRQDPDVIMVGEIRDSETAQTAVQAAHTGHLVLSTLHTNSSCEAIIRLNQMGIANYLLASAIKLIIYQRLVRILCPHCKTKNLTETSNNQLFPHYDAKGCMHCIDGYQGRTAVYECLTMSPAIEQLLSSRKQISITELVNQAKKEGMRSFYQSGIEIIKKGLTSFAEFTRLVDRVINDD